jgi:hypothetical protein
MSQISFKTERVEGSKECIRIPPAEHVILFVAFCWPRNGIEDPIAYTPGRVLLQTENQPPRSRERDG